MSDPAPVHASTTSNDLPSMFGTRALNYRALFDPIVLRSVLAVVVAVIVVLSPAPSDRALIVAVGLGLIGLGVTTIAAHVRTGVGVMWAISWSSLAIAAGLVLTVYTEASIEVVSRVVATLITIAAALDFGRSLREHGSVTGWAWPLAKLLALLSVAAVMFAFPGDILAVVAASIAASVAIVGAVAVVRSLSSAEGETPASFTTTGRLVYDWLGDRQRTALDRDHLHQQLFYEGPELKRQLMRYFVLTLLAGVIAGGGVVSDSTAVVIGAMLIAPLMTPLMAMAVSIVMGWTNRLGRSALIALAGIAIVVVIGLFLGEVGPVTLDPTTNTQIVSRSSPTILNLAIAMAAGAAGAYGLSRPDVSDALPGVAVAISLVPPLSVMGVAYASGAYDEGTGALLLFTTNAVAIIVVGGITFVLTGLTPLRVARINHRRVQTASAAVVALAVLVVGALALNGREVASNAIEQGRASNAVRRWLGPDTDNFSIQTVVVNGDTVVVTIVGPTVGVPSTSDLQSELASTLNRGVTADLRVRVQTRDVVGPDGTTESS